MELLYLGTAAAEAIPGMFCDCRFCKTAKALGGKEYRMRSGAVINGELMIDFSPDVHISSEKAGIELRKIKKESIWLLLEMPQFQRKLSGLDN